jgi:hypothetical protein
MLKKFPLSISFARAGSGLASVAVLALSTGAAQATVLSMTDYTTLSQIGSLEFYANAGAAVGSAATASSGSAYLGSYKLSSGEWVYCLSPFTDAQVGSSNYDKVTLAQFLGTGGAYEQQFALSNPNYAGLAPGYDNQANAGDTGVAGSVINKITAMYGWAYADTLVATGSISAAEKSAAFAFALWELEGESGAYGTATGGLRQSGLNADVLSYASMLFSNLSSGVWNGFSYKNYLFEVYQASPITSSQSFLVVTPTLGGSSSLEVPEPATLLLATASLLALAVSRRAATRG